MRDPKTVFREFAAADAAHHALWLEVQRDGAAMLKQVRSSLGMSQRALGTVLGVSFTWVCKVERGHDTMSRGVALKLAELLNKPPKPRPRAAPRRKPGKPTG